MRAVQRQGKLKILPKSGGTVVDEVGAGIEWNIHEMTVRLKDPHVVLVRPTQEATGGACAGHKLRGQPVGITHRDSAHGRFLIAVGPNRDAIARG